MQALQLFSEQILLYLERINNLELTLILCVILYFILLIDVFKADAVSYWIDTGFPKLSKLNIPRRIGFNLITQEIYTHRNSCSIFMLV